MVHVAEEFMLRSFLLHVVKYDCYGKKVKCERPHTFF
jgi:hypothetical protein